MDKEQRLRNYLTNQVNPIFEKLVIDILLDKPDKIVYFFFLLYYRSIML